MNHSFSTHSSVPIEGNHLRPAVSLVSDAFKRNATVLTRGIDHLFTSKMPTLPPFLRAWQEHAAFGSELTARVIGPVRRGDARSISLAGAFDASGWARSTSCLITFDNAPSLPQLLTFRPFAKGPVAPRLAVDLCDYHDLEPDDQVTAIREAVKELGLDQVIELDGLKPRLRSPVPSGFEGLCLPNKFGEGWPQIAVDRCASSDVLRACARRVVDRHIDRVKEITLILRIPFDRYEEARAFLNSLGIWWEFWAGGVLAEDCRTYNDLLRVGAEEGPVWAPLVHACIENRDRTVDDFCLAAIASDDGVRLQFSGTGGDGEAWKTKLEEATGAPFQLETAPDTPIWIDL